MQRVEVGDMRQAIAEVYPSNVPKPKLLYIIVTKRHNTRIMMAAADIANAQQANGKYTFHLSVYIQPKK